LCGELGRVHTRALDSLRGTTVVKIANSLIPGVLIVATLVLVQFVILQLAIYAFEDGVG